MPTPWRAHSDNIEGVWEGKKSQDGGREREKSVHKVKRNNSVSVVILSYPEHKRKKMERLQEQGPLLDCMQMFVTVMEKVYKDLIPVTASVLTGSLQWEPYASVHPLPIRSHWPRNVWAMQTGKDELSSSSNQPIRADP